MDLRPFLAIMLGLTVTTSASASMPSGQHFGSWQVISIGSASGTAGDDASAMILQEANCEPDGGFCDKLEVSWMQGFDIRLSIRIRDCRGNDKNFEQGYSIPTDRWMEAEPSIANRVESDFGVWLEQAELSCDVPERISEFDLKQLPAAVNNFAERLLALDKLMPKRTDIKSIPIFGAGLCSLSLEGEGWGEGVLW